MSYIKSNVFLAELLDCGTRDLSILENIQEDTLEKAIDNIRVHGGQLGDEKLTLDNIWLNAFYEALSDTEDLLLEFGVQLYLNDFIDYHFNYIATSVAVTNSEYFIEQVEQEYDTLSKELQTRWIERYGVHNAEDLKQFIKDSVEELIGIHVEE